MSMSWSVDGVNDVIKTAVEAALAEGVHVSVSAGNEHVDACLNSPSSMGGSNSALVTVGSVGMTSRISGFSNTGPCVDLYAPGEDVGRQPSWLL